MLDPRDRMIVALDLPDVAAAEAMVKTLGASVTFYKIGLELIYRGGLDLTRRLTGEGKKLFLDAKLHDIGNTVSRATASIAMLNPDFLSVHAYPQTLRAAAEGKAGSAMKVLGVTVLTSYDDGDVTEAGFALNVNDLVLRRARQVIDNGCDGIVCAPTDIAAVRGVAGPGALIVTPGVRPAGSATGDQKRVATPADAIATGADYIVVGRPVIQAADPARAAEAIVEEIAGA